MEEKIRVVVAEDQHLMRKSLISLFRDYPKIELVGEAGNGRELLDLLKETSADIVLLDVEMPVMSGPEALDIMVKRYPGLRVVILSLHYDPMLIYDLMTRGACGYLSKNAGVEAMITTLTETYHNGYYHSNDVSQALLLGARREKALNPLLEEQALTEREIEILKCLCNGKTNKEIAVILKITASTVDFHRGNIYAKTKSANIVDLVKYSIRHGFITVN